MEPGPAGLATCFTSETRREPGGAPWRRRSISVLRSRISAKPSSTEFHAALGSRERATADEYPRLAGEKCLDRLGGARPGLPVPQRDLGWLGRQGLGQPSLGGLAQGARVDADQLIGPELDRDRALGRRPVGDA